MDSSDAGEPSTDVELTDDMTWEQRLRLAKAKVRQSEESEEQASERLKELEELRLEKDADKTLVCTHAEKVKMELREVRNRCGGLTRQIGELTRKQREFRKERQAALSNLKSFRLWRCQSSSDLKKELLALEQKMTFTSLSPAEERECLEKAACLRQEQLGMQVVQKFREAVHACDTTLHKIKAERETMRMRMETLSETWNMYSDEARKRKDDSRKVFRQRAEASQELRKAKLKSREAQRLQQREQFLAQTAVPDNWWQEEEEKRRRETVVQVVKYCERLLNEQANASAGGNDVEAESTPSEKMCESQGESIKLVRLPAKKTEEEDEEELNCCNARGRRGKGRRRNRQPTTIRHACGNLRLFHALGVDPPVTIEDVPTTLAALHDRFDSDGEERS